MAKNLDDISRILMEYADEIQEGIIQDATTTAEEGTAKLKAETSTYQVRTGKYNRGWRNKVKVGDRYVHATISNKEYQLTHLLEYGHATRNGGRTRAFPHIKPVEEFCKKDFEERVIKTIKGGK